MSIEFHEEISKLQSIIERYTDDSVKSIEYRVRQNEQSERYVRVVFKLNELRPSDALEVNFENMSAAIQRYLVNEWYTLAYVAPAVYDDYQDYKRGMFVEKTSVVIKFFVD